MEQTLDNPIPSGKVYRDKAITAATFLGGPLVAGYLFAENFKVLGEPEKVKQSWYIAIVSSIIIFGGVFLVPASVNIPRQIIPLAYTGIAYLLVNKFQLAKIDAHEKAGGAVFSQWRAAGVGLLGGVLTVLPIVAIIYFNDPSLSAKSKSYGAIKNQIYYDASVTEAEVDHMAASLSNVAFFDEAQQKSIFLKKDAKKYFLLIPLIDDAWTNVDALAYFEQLRTELQAIFPDNTIVMDLCNENLDLKKRLE